MKIIILIFNGPDGRTWLDEWRCIWMYSTESILLAIDSFVYVSSVSSSSEDTDGSFSKCVFNTRDFGPITPRSNRIPMIINAKKDAHDIPNLV